ncbi:MAG: succinate dehydrogenase [Bacillus thermozeamaize]|jgi:succinate dehydrogenase / fumarate reductase cytochrome b subunit|uniref:Succinate dehydrogenase n=1 Tax=Bacillus thermozeamaize TaxID=230954 RepID=A0A1Y3PHS1_9BACI|nr:MAG: succinate dehydrogenase [Bacillus thermozeamaize]
MAKGTFFMRKIHSLFGVLPVGIFLIMHLTTNYQATKGAEAYNQAAAMLESLPFLIVLEVGLIFLPLLFHAIYGLYVMYQASVNLKNFGTFRNWMFVLQRVTGILTLIFVAWHVWETRLMRPAEPDFYQMMAGILSNPAMYWFYVVGVVAAVFHFANGMWSFLVSWGITVGPRAQQISTYVWMVVFVLLSIVGISAINAFV